MAVNGFSSSIVKTVNTLNLLFCLDSMPGCELIYHFKVQHDLFVIKALLKNSAVLVCTKYLPKLPPGGANTSPFIYNPHNNTVNNTSAEELKPNNELDLFLVVISLDVFVIS